MKDTYTNITEKHMAETDPAYDKIKARQEKSEHAKNVLRGAGYARGGGVSPVKAVHKHEKHLHKGKTETKFKHGGKIEGKKPHARADKFARGGSVPKGHHTKINISVGNPAEKQQAMQQGVQLGARMAAAKMAGGPRPGAGAAMQARPASMPAPGGPSPGMPAPGGPAPGMPAAKHGGRMYKKGGMVKGIKDPTDGAGAGGGLGRLAKIKSYGPKK